MINDELPNVLKSIVKKTVGSMNLSNFVLGEVVSEKPLAIRVGKNELDEDYLILSDNVRDFEVDIEVNHITENRAGGEDMLNLRGIITTIKVERKLLFITV